MRALAYAVTVALATASTPAAADGHTIEVHANAGFDLDIAGIAIAVGAPSGGAIDWSLLDLDAKPGSGALRLSGPAGAYILTLCLHPDAVVPFGSYAWDASVRLRSAAPIVASLELVPMFGGDDPGNDGPCARPWLGYDTSGPVAGSELRLEAGFARLDATPDASLSLLIHKGEGDVLVDDWSLGLEENPLVVDGFE